MPGAEANPYPVTAAVLAGVHHGLTRGLDPGAKHSGAACGELDESLPLALWRALAAAEVFPGYFGAEYLQTYHAVKTPEFSDFMEEISAREYRWYL